MESNKAGKARLIMATFPRSPKPLKGGIVLLDPVTAIVQRVIPLQYNPDTLTRSFEIQSVGGEGGDRTEGLRLTGPPKETIKLEPELERLLTDGDVPPRLANGGAVPYVSGVTIHLAEESDSQQLGRQIAGAVYGGLAP